MCKREYVFIQLTAEWIKKCNFNKKYYTNINVVNVSNAILIIKTASNGICQLGGCFVSFRCNFECQTLFVAQLVFLLLFGKILR